MKKIGLLVSVLAAALTSPVRAEGFDRAFSQGPIVMGAEQLQVRAVPSASHVQPGGRINLAVELSIVQGWAYYSPNPGSSSGFSPLPAGMEVDAGPLKAGEVLWPPDKPHAYELAGVKFVNNAYEGTVVAYVPIAAPSDLEAGTYTITVSPQGQVCGKDECIRLEGLSASAEITVGPAAQAAQDWDAHLAAGIESARPAAAFEPPAQDKGGQSLVIFDGVADYAVWAGLGLALLAGLILNIMPCVLPVIPLKVLSIVNSARESRRRFVSLGLAFAAGIVLFFAVLAGGNMLLKLVLGSAFQWGQHFQSPVFVVGMSALMLVLAANLFGLFTVLVPRSVAQLEARRQGKGHLSAVGMGFLTGVLSTPCSFAVLTSAFVWAQSQPLALGTIGIIAIGVGMAAPYAVLTAFPGLVSRLPRPGRWMEIFKQSMGFVLLLVAVWLLSTLSSNAYPFWIAGYAVVLTFCGWMWQGWVRKHGRFGGVSCLALGAVFILAAAGGWLAAGWLAPRGIGFSLADSRLLAHLPPLAAGLAFLVAGSGRLNLSRRGAARIAAVMIATTAGLGMLAPDKSLAVRFETFDSSRLESAGQSGQTVLVDFTASWCLNCKFVERTIYDDHEIAKKLKELNVVPMKGDVTVAGSPADQLKRALGEAVPATVIFPPDGRAPIRLRGFFSKPQLLAALEQAVSAR